MLVQFIFVYLMLVELTGSGAQNSGNVNCNFDRTMCAWSNAYRDMKVDDFNWRLGSGSKGSQKGSGTDSGYGGAGGYMYIKSKNWMNRTAMLISPSIRRTTPTCLKFWYFMKGRTMGHLAVYIATSRNNITATQKLIWNLRGHQGNQWKCGKIPLPAMQKAVVVFEAFDWERGKSGNILLDEVTLKLYTGSNTCPLQPSYAQPAIPATTSMPPTTAETATTPSNATIQATVMPPASGAMVTTKPPKSNAQAPVVSTATVYGTTNYLLTGRPTANISFPTGGILAASDAKIHTVWIILGVLLAVSVLAMGLVLYIRRRRKPRSMYSDDCSVTITRMYPNISSEPHIDYRKLT